MDGGTLVIGAWGDDDAGPQSGSAYVFVRGGTGMWSEQAKLTASDGSAGDHFGIVAVDGDTAVVGAPDDDHAGQFAGSAYVFVRDGSTLWSEQAKLMASDAGPFDLIGGSVSVHGDMAVVGASGDDDGGSEAGAAYVFVRDGSGVWFEQTKLTASDPGAFDGFGVGVSVNGNTAVIGAHGKNAAYVFVRDSMDEWSEQAKLAPSDGGNRFGVSVCVDGNTALIGAPDFDGGGLGAAYVFVRDESGIWSEQAKLTWVDPTPFSDFGWSVSLSGDNAVVGALGADDQLGAAYSYLRDGDGVWRGQAKLTASLRDRSDFHGRSVAIDGYTAVVGADGDDSRGSALVFLLRDQAPVQ
jgi:hypothetical protein